MSLADHSDCGQCGQGTYVANGTSCESCPFGRYAPTAQTDECLRCLSGFSTGVSSGATTCSSCDAGTYSKGLAVNCTTCSSGTYSGSSSASCTMCDSGKFSGGGAASCDSCAGGRYSAAGSHNCSACVGGTYSNPGAASCVACLSGTFSEMGASSCIKCDSGRYSEHSGASSCSNCTKGRYSSSSGASACDAAAAGYFCPEQGLSAEYKCSSEVGYQYTSAPASDECALCEVGFYMDIKTPPRCHSCENLCDGSDTNGVDAAWSVECVDCSKQGSTLTTLKVLPGFWRADKTSEVVYRCPNGNCLGENSSSCAKGSGGPACSVCDMGYYETRRASEVQGGARCRDCAEEELSTAAVVILVFLVAAIIMLGYLLCKYKKTFLRWMHENRRSLNVLGDTTTVLWVTMQTLVLVVQNHKESGGKDMPPTYDRFLSLFSFVAIDLWGTIPGAGCFYRPNFFESLLMTTLLCITCAMMAGLIYLVRRKDESAWKILKRVVWVSKMLLPPISLAISKAFRCKDYEDSTGGTSVLLVDHSIVCEGETYAAMLVYASLMTIIFPIGIPVIWLIKLHALRPRLEADLRERSTTRGTNNVIDTDDDPVLSVSPFLTLFVGIEARYAWFYESLDMVRRLALTCGTMLFREVESLVLFSLCIAILFLLFHTQARPHDNDVMDNIVAMMHWQTLLAIIVLLIMDAQMFEELATSLLGGVLAGVNTLMLMMLFIPVIPQMRETLRDVVKSAKHTLFPTQVVKGDWADRHRQAHSIGDKLARPDFGRHMGNDSSEFEMAWEISRTPTSRAYASSISDDRSQTRTKALDEVLHGSIDSASVPTGEPLTAPFEVVTEVTTESEDEGTVGFDNSVDESHWVVGELLTKHSRAEIDYWVQTWHEEEQMPKALKRACKSVQISKADVMEWLNSTQGAKQHEMPRKQSVEVSFEMAYADESRSGLHRTDTSIKLFTTNPMRDGQGGEGVDSI